MTASGGAGLAVTHGWGHRVGLMAALVVVVVAVGGCSSSSPPGEYLSLGDSIAEGRGASNGSFTAFAPLLARDEGRLKLLNLAAGGSTTGDVIDTQMGPATAALGRKDFAFITISAGFNDVGSFLSNPACGFDPLPATCPLADTLAQVEANMDTIMRELREANAETPIVVLLYPNYFSGTSSSWEGAARQVLPRLDAALSRVVARYAHAAVATADAAFAGKGPTLTHGVDPTPDFHPNDAGHRALADAIIVALDGLR